MEFINKEIEKCYKEHLRLLELCKDAHRKLDTKANIFNRSRLEKEYDKAVEACNHFSKNVFAKVVFDVYSPIKPKLIRVRTGQEYAWDEVFKETFDQLDKLDRGVLVGLVEENGGYRFAK